MRKLLASLCVAAGLGAGATALAGCGSDDAQPFDAAKAAAATSQKGTARMTIALSVTGAGLPLPVSVKGRGVTSLKRPEGAITFDLGPVLTFAGVPPGTKGTDLQLRFTPGGVVYAKPPSAKQLGLKLPGGKRWASLELAQVAAALDLPTKGLGKLFTLDPSAQLRALKAAKGLKEVGKEKIAGTQTTHFRGTYRLADFVRTLPAAERADVQAALARLEELSRTAGGTTSGLSDPIPADLWVDKDGVTRRMVSTTRLPAQGGQPAGTIKQRYELSDFGARLDATPPPAADTYAATKAAVGFLRSAASGAQAAP
jgi:hypothetical protein